MACTLGLVNMCKYEGKFQKKVSSERFESIISASKRRKDGLHKELKIEEIKLHRNCASSYTSDYHMRYATKDKLSEDAEAAKC